jgi:hypothetical protein
MPHASKLEHGFSFGGAGPTGFTLIVRCTASLCLINLSREPSIVEVFEHSYLLESQNHPTGRALSKHNQNAYACQLER